MQTALGFKQGRLFWQSEVHFAEVGVSNERCLLIHLLTVDLKALLGGELRIHGERESPKSEIRDGWWLSAFIGQLAILRQSNFAGMILACAVRLLLIVAVGAESVHEQIEINEVAVEFRTINAGE